MADYSEAMKLKKMQLDQTEKDLEERERKFKAKEHAGQKQEETPQDAQFDFNFTRLR